MGYYTQTNTPYDVQVNQGGKFDFESVKKRYQEVKPLIGKRKAENIRPIKRRDRYWEQVFEVSENEYYVSFDAYKYRTNHNKAISWSLNGGMETMTIHTPRRVWSGANNELYPRTLSSASVFWFYEFNLPRDFGMVNHRASKYIQYDNKYYSIELGDVVFQRKVGSNHWLPLVVHREFKHTLDRKQTKQLREDIKPFMAYYDIMHDIVDSKWEWGNAIVRALNDGELGVVKPKQALALFKPSSNGDVPNEWLGLVERYKHRLTAYNYQGRIYAHDGHKLGKVICKDLFEIVKPCNTTEVPIGTLTHDRYKGWYR